MITASLFLGVAVIAMVLLVLGSRALHVALQKNDVNDPDSLCAAFIFFGLFLLMLVLLASLGTAMSAFIIR